LYFKQHINIQSLLYIHYVYYKDVNMLNSSVNMCTATATQISSC